MEKASPNRRRLKLASNVPSPESMVARAGRRHMSHATLPSGRHLVDAEAGAPDEQICQKTLTNNEGLSLAKAARAASSSNAIHSAKKLRPTRWWRT